MKALRYVVAAAVLGGSAMSASATTINLDFSTGVISGDTYSQGEFLVTVTNPDAISTSTDCGSPCLKLSNNQIATITYTGGSYTLNSFAFNGKGNDGAFDFYVDGTFFANYSENNNGNTMSSGSPNVFVAASSYFENVGGGSSRIDSITLDYTVPSVPLPAAGIMLLTALGGLGFMRRRRS